MHITGYYEKKYFCDYFEQCVYWFNHGGWQRNRNTVRKLWAYRMLTSVYTECNEIGKAILSRYIYEEDIENEIGTIEYNGPEEASASEIFQAIYQQIAPERRLQLARLEHINVKLCQECLIPCDTKLCEDCVQSKQPFNDKGKQKENIDELEITINQTNDLTNELQYNRYQNTLNETQQILKTFQQDIQSLPTIDIGNISQTFEEIYQSIQQITQQLEEEANNDSEYETCEEILNEYYEEEEEIKEMNYCLKIYNDNEEGILPKRIHNTDAGYDLYYPGIETLTISPQQTLLVDIKIASKFQMEQFVKYFHDLP